jgi:hypothetical protein
MADLEDRHADTGEGEEIALRLLEDLERKNSRTGGEVMDAWRSGHGWALEESRKSEVGDLKFTSM